ncbi:MAG TPA: peptide-methionine (R)-S-oxide reductase MsrB [Devosia sp.]|jgi:peptide-methionine (R)-S-oxide reductase|uniref:peptide-methionine (R)-S-oxide reductase MsrB n=1 Tax=Devosia sp. TaxID=1871048 RepID=UPI002F91F08C
MVTTRRNLLLGGSALAAIAAFAGIRPMSGAEAAEGDFPFKLSDAEWKTRLDPQAYAVLRHEATERPFTSPLNDEHRQGTFLCAGCEQPLFASETKFDSGTGWPSFYTFIDGALGTSVDNTLFMTRTEVHCSNCGGHQGHVFEDGPEPTGLRYCINGVSLRFQAA